MSILNFTDGMSINTEGPYRIIRERDGLYVVGHGFMCGVDTQKEGEEMLKDLLPHDKKNG